MDLKRQCPAIWATQVPETPNKHGIATRVEVTDASHAAMAIVYYLIKELYPQSNEHMGNTE